MKSADIENLLRKKSVRVAGSILLAMAALIWALYTLRVSAELLGLGLVAALSAKPLRRCSVIVALTVLLVVVPFQPVDLTFQGIPVPPRLLQCCPGSIPYRDYEGTIAKQAAGVCAFCSDLRTGFEPRWMLFW